MWSFDWLNSLPLTPAKFIVLLAFIVPMIFAFTLPKQYIYLGAPNKKPWRNLKIWVFLLVAIQVSVYLYF